MQLQPFVSQLHFGMGRVGNLEHAEGPEGTQCALACAWAPFANELCEVGWAWTGEGGGRFSQGAVTSEVDMCIRSAGLEGLLVPVAKIKGL